MKLMVTAGPPHNLLPNGHHRAHFRGVRTDHGQSALGRQLLRPRAASGSTKLTKLITSLTHRIHGAGIN